MKEWYKEWFASEEYLEVYLHRNSDDAKKLVSLILDTSKLAYGSTILDAACGAGRHSGIFASLGYKVTGFDLSKTLLQVAGAEAKQKALNINYACGDLRKVFFNYKFDLIVNLFTSFGYFDSDEDNFSFLKNSIKILNDNGSYVLDYLNEKFLRLNLIGTSVKKLNDKSILESRRIINDRVEKEITIANKFSERKYVESVKLYSKQKIEFEMTKAGYKCFRIYGNYDSSDFDENYSSRLIMFFSK